MKLINLMIVFLGVSFSVMAAQNDTSVTERKPIELKLVGPNKVQLLHRINPEGLLYVKIYDEKNLLVTNERIAKQNPFSKKYDFSQMEPGKYQIALYDTKGNKIEAMELDMKPAADPEKLYTRVRVLDRNKYQLLVSAASPSDMVVSIYEDGDLLFTEKVENTVGIHKIYNLKNTKYKSNIEFRVRTEEGFSKLVSVVN